MLTNLPTISVMITNAIQPSLAVSSESAARLKLAVQAITELFRQNYGVHVIDPKTPTKEWVECDYRNSTSAGTLIRVDKKPSVPELIKAVWELFEEKPEDEGLSGQLISLGLNGDVNIYHYPAMDSAQVMSLQAVHGHLFRDYVRVTGCRVFPAL